MTDSLADIFRNYTSIVNETPHPAANKKPTSLHKCEKAAAESWTTTTNPNRTIIRQLF